jgi:hypothetical protein
MQVQHTVIKGLKKSKTGDIQLPMSLCCKCGDKPFENHKMGPFQGFKMDHLESFEMAPFSDFQGLIS